MKSIVTLVLSVAIGLFHCNVQAQTDPLAGAWHYQEGDREQVVVFIDGYFSHSTFDVNNKNFISTRGGSYTADGNAVTVTWQYDTEKAGKNTPPEEWVGQPSTFNYTAGSTLTINLSNGNAEFRRLDNNEGALAGVWRITGRQQADEMGQMPLRDRRTLKIMTGTRFQWAAINVKTGEFSGTGGGTYTFENGKYTENIDFFSRNNDRVGASLTFDGKVENGQWHHSGLSSAGDPIYEVWIKLED